MSKPPVPTYTDRHGRELKPGMRIRAQVCVGRYGQVAIRQGEIIELSPHGGATIRTETAFIEDCGPRLGTQHRAIGSEVYITIDRKGYHKHDDIEHHHETWTEAL